MKGRLKDLLTLTGGEWLVSFTTRENPVSMFHRMKDHAVSIEIKKANNPRSNDANAFCWAMCTDIGKAMKLSKETVYRKAIREAGKHAMMLMQNDAVETFQKIWGQKGVGWFADVVDDSKKNPGCKVIFAYYGTSTYDTAEMSRVLDYLKQDMDSLGLPIPLSKDEEERMMKAWRKA